MGRLTAGMKYALQQPVVYLGLFVEFAFDEGSEYFWSGENAISWNSTTWQGGGLIGSISMEEENQDMKARRVVFTVNNVDRLYYATAVQTQYRNRPCRIWINTLNSAGSSVTNSHLLEEGRMDTMSINADGTLTLTVESRLLDLFRPNRYTMTTASHNRVKAGDLFYDYVPFMPSAELPWGLEAAGSQVGGAGGGGGTSGGRPDLFKVNG
jgi:hypothetical protein